MTPNEFYAIPAMREAPWFDDYSSVTEEVLELDSLWEASDQARELGATRLVVHHKLHHDVDGERGVSVYALYFDGKPFALMLTGGRGGRDSRDAVVTDTALWNGAKEYVQSFLNRVHEFRGATADPDAELTNHYYGAQVVRFGEEVRLVSSDDVNPLTGNPVFDEKKYRDAFDRVIRPLGDRIGYDDGLSDPRMLASALDVLRSGVLGHVVPLDIEVRGGRRIFAASACDGQAFVHSVDTGGKYYTWFRTRRTKMMGPETLLECYAFLAEGRPPGPDCAYVAEASAAFGAERRVVHDALCAFLLEGGPGLASRIVSAMPRDGRVPDTIVDGYDTFALGFMVLDNPGLTRFCSDGYPDQDQAREIVATARKIADKVGIGETRTPVA